MYIYTYIYIYIYICIYIYIYIYDEEASNEMTGKEYILMRDLSKYKNHLPTKYDKTYHTSQIFVDLEGSRIICSDLDNIYEL